MPSKPYAVSQKLQGHRTSRKAHLQGCRWCRCGWSIFLATVSIASHRLLSALQRSHFTNAYCPANAIWDGLCRWSPWRNLDLPRQHDSRHTCEGLFRLWAYMWAIVLTKLIERGRSTWTVNYAIPWGWVLNYMKRKRLSTSIHQFLLPDSGWDGSTAFKLLLPWLPHHDIRYLGAKSPDQPLSNYFNHSNEKRN